MRHSGETVVVRTHRVEEPADLLADLVGDETYAWIRQGEGLVGWGQFARIDPGTGDARFGRAAAALEELFGAMVIEDAEGMGPVAFGSFTFDAESPGSVLVVPEVIVRRARGRSWVTVIGERDPAIPDGDKAPVLPTRVRYAGSSASEVSWLEAVECAARSIDRGELEKVVLARDLLAWSKTPLELGTLFRRLAERFPQCFTFVCEGLIGATPELLIRRVGDSVESLVLAGSAARAEDPAEDAALGDELRASSKERLEHELALRSMMDSLAPLCATLDADSDPWLLLLPNIQHLATTVSGTLDTPRSALEIAGAIHPTASVCGTPTQTALEMIRALEGADRGRYAGAIGWVGTDGDGEWGIALRCAEVEGDRARLFAGVGIVRGSVPERELEETRLKLRAMQSALAGSPG